MTADHVAAETVSKTQGFFEVDFMHAVQAGGAVERFTRDINLVLLRSFFDDGQTHPVMGDGVTQRDISEIKVGRVQGQTQALFEGLNVGDFADGGDDACEHDEVWRSKKSVSGWRGKRQPVESR